MALGEKGIEKTIDIRGQICPYTLIETRDALKTIGIGQVLEVLCDYQPAARETIPRMCTKKGYPFEVTEEGERLWKILIEKAEQA